MQAQRGFSLLEAIVALVLVSTVGISLFAWVNTQLDGLYRLEGHHLRQYAQQNALEFIQVINPMLNPVGKETVGIYQFSWNAVPLEEPRDGRYVQGGGIGLFRVGLYDTHVQIFLGDAEQAFSEFHVRLFGYEQVREPEFLSG